MHFETWIYDLKGHRRKLYYGKSLAKATDALDIVAEAINLLRLTVSVRVDEVTSMGTSNRVCIQKDYIDGCVRRESINPLPRDLTLVLNTTQTKFEVGVNRGLMEHAKRIERRTS